METPQRLNRHRKRDSDPLADLPDIIVEPSDREQSENGSESLLARIILGPLIMLGFLMSLCVVDSHQRAWRVAQHQHDSGTWWRKLSPWTRWNTEPYQSPQNSTWQHVVEATNGSDATHGNVPASAVDTERWYLRKKHRKIAKLALSDALEMKGKMAFTLVATGLLGLLAVAWLVKHLYSSLG